MRQVEHVALGPPRRRQRAPREPAPDLDGVVPARLPVQRVIGMLRLGDRAAGAPASTAICSPVNGRAIVSLGIH